MLCALNVAFYASACAMKFPNSISRAQDAISKVMTTACLSAGAAPAQLRAARARVLIYYYFMEPANLIVLLITFKGQFNCSFGGELRSVLIRPLRPFILRSRTLVQILHVNAQTQNLSLCVRELDVKLAANCDYACFCCSCKLGWNCALSEWRGPLPELISNLICNWQSNQRGNNDAFRPHFQWLPAISKWIHVVEKCLYNSMCQNVYTQYIASFSTKWVIFLMPDRSAFFMNTIIQIVPYSFVFWSKKALHLCLRLRSSCLRRHNTRELRLVAQFP